MNATPGKTATSKPGVRLTDSTLRDGSHAIKHQYTEDHVVKIAGALDKAGLQVIEVTHGDGLAGSTFNYGFGLRSDAELVEAAVKAVDRAKIAVLVLPGLGTVENLREVHGVGAQVARVATHCTEADVSVQHFTAARELGMETVGFLMLSHRIGPDELAKQARIMADAGCQCVYVVDSAGALLPDGVRDRTQALVAELGNDAQVGFHGHQNLSLGVANSIVAYENGARQIDGTLCALGAGAGNSPTEILATVFELMDVPTGVEHRRGVGRGRGGAQADDRAAAGRRSGVDRAGPVRRLQLVPAARRAGRRSVRGVSTRDPAQGRRGRICRRSGGHDHRCCHRTGPAAAGWVTRRKQSAIRAPKYSITAVFARNDQRSNITQQFWWCWSPGADQALDIG